MISVRQIFVTIIFVSILFYFVYHTIFGSRGYIALSELNHKIQITTLSLQNLQSERLELEHNASLLRPESLDRDMLDEQARKLLGFAKKNEEVIIMEIDK